jgi:hypothetical protein
MTVMRRCVYCGAQDCAVIGRGQHRRAGEVWPWTTEADFDDQLHELDEPCCRDGITAARVLCGCWR